MYSFNTYIAEKSTRSIIDNMDDKFEDMEDKITDIDTKLQSIENLISTRLEVCYKRVSDIYSMQNKANEINKMNKQSINRQINQYDEEIEDPDINQKHVIYNSVETSMSPSPQSKFDKLNNQCFIKHNTKNQDKELFYMSSKNEMHSKNKTENYNTSETSVLAEQIKPNINYLNKDLSSNSTSSLSKENDINLKNIKSEKSNSKKSISDNDERETDENNIFTNIYKNNSKSNVRIVKDNISLENESNLEEFINSLPNNIVENFFQKNKTNSNFASVILEMNEDIVKPYKVETSSPKFTSAMKILNETNIIKNNSHSKLNEINNKTTILNNSSTSSNEEKSQDNTEDSDNSDNSDNLDINNFGNTVNFANIIDLGGANFIFTDIAKQQNNEKIVELND